MRRKIFSSVYSLRVVDYLNMNIMFNGSLVQKMHRQSETGIQGLFEGLSSRLEEQKFCPALTELVGRAEKI